MPEPHVVDVIQGEHLYKTLKVNDNSLDMSTATAITVKAAAPLFIMSLTAAAGSETDEVVLSSTAAKTTFAPVGTYKAEFWGEWAGSPTKKMVASCWIAISEAADA